MNFYKLLIFNFLLIMSCALHAQINLTSEEKTWIKQTPIVSTPGSNDWNPFNFTKHLKKTKQYIGIIDDYLNIISHKTELVFEMQIGEWHTNIDKAISKQIDLLPVLSKVDKKTDYKLSYWPVLFFTLLALTIFAWAKSLRKAVKKNTQTQVELAQEKINFQTLFKNSSDGHIIIQDNTIIDCNLTAISLLGLKDKQKVIKMNLANIISGKQPNGDYSLNCIYEGIHKCFENGVTRFEYLATHSTIKYFWVDVIFTLIKYNGSDAVYATWRDISEQKKLAHELTMAQKTATDANKAKSEFLANMSHEIRTPMNAILGFTDLLSEQLTNPKHQSFVKTIKSASKNLLSLINDILDFSKIEAGKYNPQKKPINPYDLINEICQVFSLNIQEKQLEFEIEIDSNFPPSIVVDPVHIRQVLFNLFSNAIKFTDKGHIIFRAKVDNLVENLNTTDIIFEIEDSGIGIENDQLETVFNVFEQHKGQDNSQYQGTGLGLAIIKNLIANMGGTISVSSQKDVGSVFTVNLHNVDIATEKLSIKNKLKKNQLDTIIIEKSTILIADDIDYNRELISQIFGQTDVQILEAENGLEAINQVNQHLIDLVIMDIRMPVMDGYTAARKIRKSHPNMPIVALTASTLESDKHLNKDLFDSYLRKPVLKNNLIMTLAKYLPHRTIQRLKNKSETKPITETIDLKELDKLLETLKGEIYHLWTKANKSNHFTDITLFSDSLEQNTHKYPIPLFKNYVTDLKTKIDVFDIAGIQKIIGKFPEMIAEIEKM